MSFLVELPLERYRADAFSGFAQNPDFSLGNARALMWLSQLAYEIDPDKVAAVAQRWGFTRITAFRRAAPGLLPSADSRGLFASGHGAHFLTFAGTDPLNFANWLTDFDVRRSPDDLHGGFAVAAAVVWTDATALLGDSGAAGPLFVAGHSLGAAIAVLLAHRLAHDKNPPAAVYAYGMPRAGGQTFADDYAARLGQRTFRLVLGEDVVTRLPPENLGYRHVGRLLRAPHGGRFASFQASGRPKGGPPGPVQRNPLLALITPDVPKNFGLPFVPAKLPAAVGDHLQDRYLYALEPDRTTLSVSATGAPDTE